MKKCLSVFGVLCLTLSLVGCSGNQVFGQEESQATVELEGNPTTGYEWTYELSNPAIIKEVSYEYIGYQEDEDVVGVGGVFVFGFAGLAEGESEITFNYMRSWEETPPEKTVTYLAVVDSNNNLTLTRK